jgi:Bacterial protein of unknown function (DUF899)
LFGGRRQLIVYHFMVAPDWDLPCAGCASFTRHISGGACTTSTERLDEPSRARRHGDQAPVPASPGSWMHAASAAGGLSLEVVF